MSQNTDRSTRHGAPRGRAAAGRPLRLPPRLRVLLAPAAARELPVGVCIDRTVAIAAPAGGSWQVEEFERPDDDAGLRSALTATVERLDLIGRPVILTLPVGSYSLLQIERPPVPPEELAEACRWKSKDLVEFPVDDALIEVFEAAPVRGRGDHTMVNVVLTPTGPIRAALAALRAAGLRPAGVEIAELALRKLAAVHAEDTGPVALLGLGARHGVVQICQGDTLLFSRRLDYGLRALGNFDPNATGPHSRLPLDLQRTLDYFDRNYEAGAVGHLLIAPNQPQLLAFMRSVGADSGLSVSAVDVSGTAADSDAHPVLQSAEAALAMGGALRSSGQSVNLMSSLAPGSGTGLGMRPALTTIAASVLCCLVVGLWMQGRLDAAVVATRQLERDIEMLSDDLADRSTFLSERNADPALIGEMRGLERESAEKRNVLEALAGSTLGNTHGFSAQLEALGRSMPGNIWLTRIAFAQGGAELRLEGETTDAGHIPELLEALNRQEAFNGTSLARLSLARAGPGAATLKFVLATPCVAGPSGDGAGGAAACGAISEEEPAS